MQITEVVSTVHSIIAAIKMGIPVWTAISAFIVYCYVRSRSGSSNFLRERLWRILGGAGEFNDQSMDARWKRVTDFERYRYSSGIKFQRMEQIAQFESWLEERHVALEEVLPYSRYYDLGKNDLRDPNLRGRQRNTAMLSLLILAWVSIFGFLLFSDAQMRVKASNTFFWISTTEAKAAFTGSWRLTPSDCAGDSTSLAPGDKDVICQILTTKEGKEFVENARQSQAQLSATMIGTGVAVFLIIFFSLMRAWDAHHFYSRSRARQIESSPEITLQDAEGEDMYKTENENVSS